MENEIKEIGTHKGWLLKELKNKGKTEYIAYFEKSPYKGPIMLNDLSLENLLNKIDKSNLRKGAINYAR